MNAKVLPAKMEEHAPTMLTPTHVPVGPALLAFTVKPTSLIALKARASTEGHALIRSMAIPAHAARASLAPTANMKSMSVIPSLASMGAYVKMPWSPSAAPVPRATLATDARHQWIGVGAHLHARMEVAVARRMLPSFVIVRTAGLDVTVTSPESPVRQLLAKEASRQMNCATMGVTVSTQEIPTTANVPLTTPGATAKIKWTTVRTNLVAMVPPAGDMWEVTSVIVCQAILGKTVRSKSMSASLTHARMEALALIWLDIISVPALLAH